MWCCPCFSSTATLKRCFCPLLTNIFSQATLLGTSKNWTTCTQGTNHVRALKYLWGPQQHEESTWVIQHNNKAAALKKSQAAARSFLCLTSRNLFVTCAGFRDSHNPGGNLLMSTHIQIYRGRLRPKKNRKREGFLKNRGFTITWYRVIYIMYKYIYIYIWCCDDYLSPTNGFQSLRVALRKLKDAPGCWCQGEGLERFGIFRLRLRMLAVPM